MDDPYAVDRRGFLKTGAASVAATAVACGSDPGRWGVVSNAEAHTQAAACDRIVPPDDFPGAAEAGAVEFIDRQLATGEAARLPEWQAGLRALDAAARRHGADGFPALRVGEQTALLEDVERGAVSPEDWGDVEPRAFFDRLVWFTMMSFYGDPRHGGNRQRVSWRMLGLPDPPVRGRHDDPNQA